MTAYISPSDYSIFDLFTLSLSASNYIAVDISAGGYKSFISYLITSTPHFKHASLS